ncbi:hypothetical protein [Massilia sp. erpn]|uniref:hypothetical protein n=1 Tax=Massilia sp. erpn TaxID=2738142 RepID=UPI0021053F19|nr:hypothetical protein [Massilia sp. erpn]UTY56173.1 hypothetical protein HPQ68_02580 [Massilia sp. erpn]
MRKIIAALQISLDGFIEGVGGELDWIDTWDDSFGLVPQIDTCILGSGMYPGYAQYWSAILANQDHAAGQGRPTMRALLHARRISCCREH